MLSNVRMVQVEIAGKPILELDYDPKENGELKRRVREKVRGSSTISSKMHFTWHNISPWLVLTSDTSDFDQTIVEHFREEGFHVSYLAYNGDKKEYSNQLRHLADPLELGDKYAIVGEPAMPAKSVNW